jgi:hypothetical protein
MHRSKAAAVVGLLMLVATSVAGGVCGLILCGEASGPAACHSTTSPEGPRLTDCCAAHSPEGARPEMALDALSVARVAALIESPDLVQPELTLPATIDLLPDRSAPIALFTLHRSLLL